MAKLYGSDVDNFDVVGVKNRIVEWIRDWFEENGKGCNAVLGISGGKDSSIVAALCVEALGKDRVVVQVVNISIVISFELEVDGFKEAWQFLGIYHLGIKWKQYLGYFTIDFMVIILIMDLFISLFHSLGELLNACLVLILNGNFQAIQILSRS